MEYLVEVDPLAGKYPGWSPYNYTLWNPIRYIDPDGRAVKDKGCGCPPDCPEYTLDPVIIKAKAKKSWFERTWENIKGFLNWDMEGTGGAQVYANGTQDLGRKNGKANMKPIDISLLVTPTRLPKIGPLLKGASFLSSEWHFGQQLGQAYEKFHNSGKRTKTTVTYKKLIGVDIEHVSKTARIMHYLYNAKDTSVSSPLEFLRISWFDPL